MGLFDNVLDALARKLQKRIIGLDQAQAFRDAGRKGESYSVESMVAENLANLACLNFTLPVEGGTARASWLDSVSDAFTRNTVTKAIAQGLLTGDCIVVPSWSGAGMVNTIVDANMFAITGESGGEITSCIYIVDQKKLKSGSRWTLLRSIDLVPYVSEGGEHLSACRYRTFLAKDGVLTDAPLSTFPDWEATNEPEWVVPNVSRLLIGRFRCPTVNPLDPNAAKGVPVCYGASDPIREVHYLTEQMHAEFALSEKAIIADKRIFKKREIKGDNGQTVGFALELPKGRERLFMDVNGGNELGINEWAPSIQLQPYVDALEVQYKRIEKLIGVDAGIISTPNELNYMNVDNVRKSTIHTQAFVNAIRKQAEMMITALVESWDMLANYYGITPVGDYNYSFDWSDDYINTFADMQSAILAGNAIGATDAIDYRAFVLGENPEQARQRVNEIKSQQVAEVL